MTTTLGRTSHRIVNRPTDVQAMSNERRVNAKPHCPIRDSQCLAIKGYAAIYAGVARLLRLRGPSTILRTVGAIIIDAVEAIQRSVARSRSGLWAWSHVGVKGFKRVIPALADRNATPAVVFPLRSLWIRAALAHVQPQRVFRWFASGWSHAVRAFLRACDFAPEAAATFLSSVVQEHEQRRAFRSAIALAMPIGLPLPRWQAVNSNQASEALSRDVSNWCHMFKYSTESVTA